MLLLVSGIVTRFLWISRPPQVVWDEQHFVGFTNDYLQGRFFFDRQPPLGDLILLAGLKIAHAHSTDVKLSAGEPYPPHYPYIAFRFLPALAGALLPVILYLLGRSLSLSISTSFFVGALAVCDNAILAESHFGLIDIFVPFFGFLGLLAFVQHRKRERFSWSWWGLLSTAAIFGALSTSVKWTGFVALAAMGMATAMELVDRDTVRVFIARVAILCTVSAAIYMSVFALHFRLLPNSGAGDGFMSPAFRATLLGTPESERKDRQPLKFWPKFTELNKQIFLNNSQKVFFHPESSRFYEWPIGKKSLLLWQDRHDRRNRIWLLANPVVWFFGFFAMIAGLLVLVIRRKAVWEMAAQSPAGREKLFALEFLFWIYAANWLPFVLITREMYLYHYFSAMLDSLLVGSFMIFEIVPSVVSPGGELFFNALLKPLYWIVLLLAAVGFIFLAPLSYGFQPFHIR